METGKEHRPITDVEFKRTTVYAIEIESWSGKGNWKERADLSVEWPPLDAKWFEYFIDPTGLYLFNRIYSASSVHSAVKRFCKRLG